MIRILFLINTLGGGGAERALVNLVNHLDYDKYDVTVETMFGEGNNKKDLREKVHYINKGNIHIRGMSYIIRLIPAKMLFKYYVGNERYDIIVAYMHGAPTKVVSGCADKSVKKVTWLHNGNPATGSFFHFWINKRIAIRAYKSLDAIIGVSQTVTKAFYNYTHIAEKCQTLYNVYDLDKIRKLSIENIREKFNAPVICSVGSLTNVKGYDRLINAVNKLKDRAFTVLIIGEGAERKHLLELIDSFNLSDKIKLLGFQDNPYKYMAQANLFVSVSRGEGLATVLIEALTIGLPVISTDVSGAKEVLGENNEYGMVVSNSTEGIYEGLMTYFNTPSLFEEYKKTAKQRAEDFNVQNTIYKIETFFESLVNKR